MIVYSGIIECVHEGHTSNRPTLKADWIPITECLMFDGPGKEMENGHCKVVPASAPPLVGH